MADQNDAPVALTFEQAVAMLPDGEEVHTFRQAGWALLGASWPREKIIAAIKEWGAELSGPAATGTDHGLALRQDGRGVLFIETKPREAAQ